MKSAGMVFKMPKPEIKTMSPVIRLSTKVASRVNEIVEQTGLTPSQAIEQMLDYIGDWSVE